MSPIRSYLLSPPERLTAPWSAIVLIQKRDKRSEEAQEREKGQEERQNKTTIGEAHDSECTRYQCIGNYYF